MTAAIATKVRYRKTKAGEWVAYGLATEVTVGAVTVHKADGTAKTEQVTRVGKAFQVDGVAMVYGYLAARTASRTGGTEMCAECDTRPGIRMARDSSGFTGLCCARCASQPSYTLSFA